MKFRIKKNVLLDALNNVSKAISTKNIIPILSGIKFELLSDKLILTASDNDIVIQTIIQKSEDMEIIKTGNIVIKGRYILDIIRKLTDEFVDIEIIDDHKIIIYTENSQFNLNGIDVKEYPVLDLDLSTEFITLNMSDFRNMVLQTNYASSVDESRVVLTGVNIKVDNKMLECSATDSYRLAMKKIKLLNNFEKEIDVVVPSKNLNELLKVLPNDVHDKLNVYMFTNKIIFKFDNIIFQSRLINGNYPNIKNLIPNDSLFDLKLNKVDFFNMVDRASILNNDSDNNTITLEINNGLLKITSMSLEVGKVEEKLSVKCDENIKISFSSKYMMEALRTIRSEKIILTFVGEVKPLLIKEDSDEDLLCLILPIRTY